MAITLNEIKDNKGARREKKRLGRGIGSGLGKTSGRGGKGQTARSGVSINGFEGGQTPIYRRLPKRGFKNIHAVPLFELTFRLVNTLVNKKVLDPKTVLNREFLVEKGYMKAWQKGISLITKDVLEHKVDFEVTRASASAQEMVKTKGGNLTLLSSGE